MSVLGQDFFARPTLEVARDLIGVTLVHEHKKGKISGRIVETEAYTQDDPASHSFGVLDRVKGRLHVKRRGYGLFEAPGTAYVYLTYGMYWLFNVVTEPAGIGGAVLIRAVEPLEGLDLMRAHRPGVRKEKDLTNGPGKLALAFGIDGRFHKRMLTGSPLFFEDTSEKSTLAIGTSSRIGIRRGTEFPWRFFVRNNPFVSPGKPSDHVLSGRDF